MELFLSDAAIGFGHQDQLMPGDIVLLDRLGDNSFRISIGVNICRVPLIAI